LLIRVTESEQPRLAERWSKERDADRQHRVPVIPIDGYSPASAAAL
jgi:hypothetical protein